MNKNNFIKLILIFLIPVIGMVFYSVIYINDKYEILDESNNIRIGINYVHHSELLLTNIQKERGLSAAYIGAKGKKYSLELKKQKLVSDKYIKSYINFITSPEFENIKSIENIKEIQKSLFFLNNLRKNVLELKLSLNDELKRYNKITNKLIDSISKLLLDENNKLVNKRINAVINLIIAKEYAGLERAILINILSNKDLTNQKDYNKILNLIALQKNNLDKFSKVVNIDELNFYNKSLNIDIINLISKYRKNFYLSYKSNSYFIEEENWWKVSTSRINSMAVTIEYIMNKIQHESEELTESVSRSLYYSFIYSFIGLVALFISIFQLKKLTIKEEENFFNLNKLKQIYNILSHTNELIIYNYKMKEVLNKACLFATKELDLSISFVCMVDENLELKIVESSKSTNIITEDFLPNKINSVYQKSYFEKHSIIIDDIFNNKSSLDLEIEKKHNIQSLGVYPLFKKNTVVGVIVFAAANPNFFDKEIIAIFKKMSNDLSYGLLKEEKEALRVTNEDELRIASYAFDSQEAMAITDVNANIVKVNKAFTRITGYEEYEVIGKNPKLLQSGKHNQEFYEHMWEELSKNGYWTGELYNKRKNGEIYPEKTTITAIKDNKENSTHYIAQFFDITEVKVSEEKLMHGIQHDPLTGLYNRIVLDDRLNQSIISANRHNHLGALLFLDLDNFKYINDSLGHNVGDMLLKKIAEILQTICRGDDLVIRLGGDEFVILVHNLGRDKSQAIINVETFAYKIIKQLDQALTVGTHKLTTTVSIGIACFPEFGKQAEDILKNADTAMYLAKEEGKNRIAFYYPDLDAKSKKYLEVETDLRSALLNNEFELYYQAKRNYKTKQVVGYEALIRWNHPTKGLLFPDDFIYIAEQSSLIIDIGKWVINSACIQINNWLKEDINLNEKRISVNISCLELEQLDFIENTQRIITSNNLDTKYLDFEITETTMFKNIDIIIDKLEKLQKLGIHTSMDDFGTGFSSLNYLSKLPVNTIKLDKSFIKGKRLSVNEAIIDMVIKISKDLNISLIIEGVENIEDVNYLMKKNSFVYQGYHFSKPIKAKDAIKLIDK